MYDCIILGGGISGLTAAIYAARAGLSVAVIEKEQCGGQAVLADFVENYPGFTGSGFELIEKIEEQAVNSGAEIIYDEIEAVDFDSSVKKAAGTLKTYEGKTIIVSTGASHKEAGFEGEENFLGAGVSYCAACDGMFFRDKTTAVIGGANSAVSEALYLSNICKKVYLIYRRDKLRADYTLVKRLEEKENVEIIYNSIPVAAEGCSKVERLVTNNSEIELDGIFVDVGLKPQTEVFKGKLSLDGSGYIKTDIGLKTSVDGVFAAGDCRANSLKQMISAAADGAAAATGVIKTLELLREAKS